MIFKKSGTVTTYTKLLVTWFLTSFTLFGCVWYDESQSFMIEEGIIHTDFIIIFVESLISTLEKEKEESFTEASFGQL